MKSLRSTPFDRLLLVERHHAEAFAAEAVVPGVEVHADDDVTWVVHPGATWRNSAIMVRFSPRTARRRIGTLFTRYEKHRRGFAVWVSPLSTPAHLADLLTERRMRCQKYFPAMVRDLSDGRTFSGPERPIEIRRVLDGSEFKETRHPAIGALTTTLRRRAFERLCTLVREPGARTRAFVAWNGNTPIGSLELFLGSEAAGVHSLRVPAQHQGRGVATALLEHACSEAARHGARLMVLLASSEGQRLYERRGFTVVGHLGHWYRSFQRG